MSYLDFVVLNYFKKIFKIFSIGGYPFGLLFLVWCIQLPFGKVKK